jgi:hypothetical protein
MVDILDSIGLRKVTAFKKDFIQMIRVSIGMDKDYGKCSPDFDFYFPKYKKLIQLFDKKYKNLKLKLKRTEEELKMRIFIKEKNVVDAFNKVASKIIGLKSIGATGFGIADVSESDRFAGEINTAKDKLYISYYEAESGSNTIYLEYDKKMKMVEVHYNWKAVGECKSPEYKLIAFYGTLEFDSKVDLLTPASKFGFSDKLLRAEVKKWLDDFEPKFTE